MDRVVKGETGTQTSNRRQEKDDRNKLLPFDTDSTNPSQERSETINELISVCQTLNNEQLKLCENVMWITKEAYKKQRLLKEKLLKTAETLKKVQLSTACGDKVESEDQRNTGKDENMLYCTQKGKWDLEKATDRALGSTRVEGQGAGLSNSVTKKDDIGRQKNHVKETNAAQKEKRREGTEWRNTKAVEKEQGHFDELTNNTWKRPKTEKDKIRRERAMEWQEDEMREQDQRDWQEEEIERMSDGKRIRREKGELKKIREIYSKDPEQDLMEKFASNFHINRKAVSKHGTTNIHTGDDLMSQQSVHQYSNEAEELLATADPSANDDESLQEVEFVSESSPGTDFQLVPCKVCERCFTEDRLEKHMNICQKKLKQKRQVYDMAQHRARGTELEKYLKTNGPPKSPELKNNWNQKPRAFVQNLRQAHDAAAGGFQPSADLNLDYVTCPHCNRRFAPGPAERHIPKCQSIKNRFLPPGQRY